MMGYADEDNVVSDGHLAESCLVFVVISFVSAVPVFRVCLRIWTRSPMAAVPNLRGRLVDGAHKPAGAHLGHHRALALFHHGNRCGPSVRLDNM